MKRCSTGSLIAEILSNNATSNSAPPAFPLIVGFILKFGTSEVFLRLIPCLASVLGIPLIYALARQFLDRRWSYLAAILTAIAPTQIYYAQQAREYSLAFSLSAALILGFTLFVRRPGMARSLWLSAIIVISLFTQYGLGLMIAACSLVALVALISAKKQKTTYLLWLIPQVFGLLAVVVVYHLSLKYQFEVGGRGAQYLVGAYWEGSLRSLYRLAVWNSINVAQFAFPTVLPLFLVIIAATWCVIYRSLWLALALILTPAAVVFLSAMLRIYPYKGIRQCIFLLPLLYVFIALGVWKIRASGSRGWLPAIIAVVFLVMIGLNGTRVYYKNPGRENIRPIITHLKASLQENDQIYVYYGALPAFKYYWRSMTHPWIAGKGHRDHPEQYLREIDMLLDKNGRLWLLFSHNVHDEERIIVQHIKKLREVSLVVKKRGASLYLIKPRQ